MTIWLLAIVLMVAAVSAGYVQGAIRVAFALVGIVAGVLLAMPLSPLFTPLLPFIGITNAWTLAVIAPIVAFFAVEVAFKVAGAFVHRKVEYYFKYHMTDVQRSMWERMNRATGASLASIGGAIFFVLVCLLISVVGYFTVQVGAAESQSSILRYFTKMAQDASVTRMDKVVGGMSPAPQSYYETSDFLGFLVHNRNVFKRMTTYPPFAALSADHYLDGDPARSKYVPARDLIDGGDYLKTLATETDLSVILDNARTQEILTNAALREWLRAIDLNDLAQYLKTGQSPKYSEPILGTWTNDFPAAFMFTKNENPDMLASDLIKYKKEMPERFQSAFLRASLDGVIIIKLPPKLENTRCPSVTNAPPRVSYTGQWTKTGAGYDLGLRGKAETKPSVAATAIIRQETVHPAGKGNVEVTRIYLKIDNKTVCFTKIPE